MTFRTGKTRPAGADSTNGARQARARRGLSCLAAGLALAFLGGCDNLFSGEDLKAKIKDEVTVTNAEEVTVTVRPDPAMPGATGTAVSVTKQKVGVPFPISVSVNEDYTFIGWTSAGDGSPSYEKVGSVSTTATIGTSGSNIIIQANFATKPKVLSTDPRSDQDQVVLNKSLTIFFSEDIDPSSLAKSLFTITSIGIGMSGMPASIIDKYDDPFAVGTNGIRLPIKSSALLGQTNQIDVTLSSALPFLSGRSMKASKSWSFYTGTSSDTTAPNFDSVNSKIQPALGPDGETNASPIIIDVIAGDTEGTVQLMRIRETPIDPPGPAVEYSYDNVYQRNLSYPLATAGEGSKKIEVWVADNNGNWTPSPWTKTIIFDRSLPVVSGFSLDSGAAYSADTSVTASASVSDANDDIQARFSNDGTTYGAWTAFNGLTTLTIPVNDGLKTVYAQFRDAAGNLAADTYQDSIELDGTLPLVSLARTPAGASIAGGTVVSFVATIVEAGGFTSTPTLAVAGVESGLVMSTLSSSSPWIYACDWTVPSNTIYDGVHAVIVSATDRAGNVNSVTSGANSIAIDNTPPGDVSGATATANAGGTVTLAWTNPGDVDFRRVRVSWTGPAPGTTTETHTCADDATTFTTDVLADGSYSFAIKTEDDLGNIQA
ncbi:MAG TPA: Ig-like domain-containing protein, partial [Spirochaetia bacterium]|nr:Ig-like domain-containing protein [Spirochaetia bacterium]